MTGLAHKDEEGWPIPFSPGKTNAAKLESEVSERAYALLSEKLRNCMVIRRDSYERLRKAVATRIRLCELTDAEEGSIEACAAEDDLIEWRLLLKQLDDAFNAGS